MRKISTVFSSSAHAEDVKELQRRLALVLQKLGEMTSDRDEWRTQHENLLAMYRAEVAKRAA